MNSRSFFVPLCYFFLLIIKLTWNLPWTNFEVLNTVLLAIGIMLYNIPSAATLVRTIFQTKNVAFVFMNQNIYKYLATEQVFAEFQIIYIFRFSCHRHKMINAYYTVHNYPCKTRSHLISHFNLVAPEIRIIRYIVINFSDHKHTS